MVKNLVLVSFMFLAGCAATPPPRPLTVEEGIMQASAAAALAGGDGQAVYDELHLNLCLHTAQQLDPSKRSAAIAQCRIDWPYQPRSAISTSCTGYGNTLNCRTQ